MRDAEHSRTALLVAALRDRGPCDDRWAGAFAGDEGQALADRLLADHPHLAVWLGVRTLFIDDCVRRGDWAQVVILGAGLDTRAARLDVGARFFEVDAPASQAVKQARIAAVDYPADAAVYVPCDFEHDDFLERLVACGFDVAQPTLFVWEGVAYYLPEAAVRATFERVLRCPTSAVVFDMITEKLVAASHDPKHRGRLGLFAEVGEPLRFGLDDPLPFLHGCGFRFVETTRFDHACLNLLGSYDRGRGFHFQTLTVAAGRRPW